MSVKRIIIGLVLGAIAAFFLIAGGGIWSDIKESISKSGVVEDKDGELDSKDAAEGENGSEASGADNIRYITRELVSNMKAESEYEALSNEKLAWWFKRDDNHGPSDCDHTIDISGYDGYYLDTSVWEESENSADDVLGGGELSSNVTDSAGQGEEMNSDNEESAETEKVIYLTLDCGYDNGLTAGMLDVLKKYDVPACFFVTQTYIRDNVELVKRMKEEGHQVGNHTITHPVLANMSYDEIVQELSGCYDYMKEATGYDMDPYFRPPCGEYSERVLAIAKDMGYKTIFWSMAYYDYDVNEQPGADYVIEHFKKYSHNGAIILMHNVSTSNAEALETVIKNLQAEGYRFAGLNELP